MTLELHHERSPLHPVTAQSCTHFSALNSPEWKGCLVLIQDRKMLEALQKDLREATRFRNISRLYIGAPTI